MTGHQNRYMQDCGTLHQTTILTMLICDIIYQNESNVGIFWSSESSAEVIVRLKKIFITNFDFGEITFIMMLFCQGNKNIISYL